MWAKARHAHMWKLMTYSTIRLYRTALPPASVPGGPHVASSIPRSRGLFSQLSCRHHAATHQQFKSMQLVVLEATPLSSSGSKLLVEACGS